MPTFLIGADTEPPSLDWLREQDPTTRREIVGELAERGREADVAVLVGGIDLLRAVRADAELQSIPVLMVAADVQKENINEAVQAGSSTCAVKPFPAEALEDQINEIFIKA